MKIRTANIKDVQILIEFEQMVVAAERPFAENLKNGDVHYYDIPALIANEDSQLLVGGIDRQIVASGYVRIESSKPHIYPARHGYLGFICVHPDYRGQGYAGEIINELMAWSKQQQVYAFRLDVYAANEAAIRSYKKLGFKANLLEMWRKPD